MAVDRELYWHGHTAGTWGDVWPSGACGIVLWILGCVLHMVLGAHLHVQLWLCLVLVWTLDLSREQASNSVSILGSKQCRFLNISVPGSAVPFWGIWGTTSDADDLKEGVTAVGCSNKTLHLLTAYWKCTSFWPTSTLLTGSPPSSTTQLLLQFVPFLPPTVELRYWLFVQLQSTC